MTPSKTNELMSEISDKNEFISPITQNDFDLFQSFFQNEPSTYGNSWTYILQGMYNLGPQNLGYKYFDGENLSAIGLKPKLENQNLANMYWKRPMGKTILSKIGKLAHEHHREYSLITYTTKLFKEQYNEIVEYGFKPIDHYPWHSTAPSEDDHFPEQILEIKNTTKLAQSLGRTRQLNRSWHQFLNTSKDPNLSKEPLINNSKKAMEITEEFFNEYKLRNNQNISNPSDYFNMILNKDSRNNMLANIINYNGIGIGYYVCEIQDESNASLYATITLRNSHNNLTDYIMFSLLEELEKRNVRWLNLGGSEHEQLDKFKKKFRPVKSRKMYWSVYNGA